MRAKKSWQRTDPNCSVLPRSEHGFLELYTLKRIHLFYKYVLKCDISDFKILSQEKRDRGRAHHGHVKKYTVHRKHFFQSTVKIIRWMVFLRRPRRRSARRGRSAEPVPETERRFCRRCAGRLKPLSIPGIFPGAPEKHSARAWRVGKLGVAKNGRLA